MQVVLCLNLGTISMLYPTFHKYCKAKHHRYFFFSWNPNTFVVKPYITYNSRQTKVHTYFRFVLKNIFTRTTVKYTFLCVFGRVKNFSFHSFRLCRVKNIWKTKIIFTSSNTKFTLYRFWLSKIQNIWRRIIFRTVTKFSFQSILC